MREFGCECVMWVGRVSIRWAGDGLLRMNKRDIRNEEVLIVRSECAVELISNEGYVGD